VKVDARIISATNCDLAKAVSEGRSGKPFLRLNVFQIAVPPLRERKEDILPLVWSFCRVQQEDGQADRINTTEKRRDPSSLSWPGK